MFSMSQYAFSCRNIRESADKVVLVLLLMFVSAPLCSQIIVSGDSVTGSPLGKSFLATRTPLGKEHSALKIITREISVQEHEGVEVYREEREVEYTVKEVKGNYSVKRKVTKKEKTSDVNAAALADKFIDMTSEPQNTFLSTRKVKERKLWGQIRPAAGVVMRNGGITSVLIDKMASIRDEYTDESGKVVMVKFMGNVTEMTECTETLRYSSLSDKLYIDDLKAIDTVLGSIYTEKGGKPLNMRNIEHIEIVGVEY